MHTVHLTSRSYYYCRWTCKITRLHLSCHYLTKLTWSFLNIVYLRKNSLNYPIIIFYKFFHIFKPTFLFTLFSFFLTFLTHFHFSNFMYDQLKSDFSRKHIFLRPNIYLALISVKIILKLKISLIRAKTKYFGKEIHEKSILKFYLILWLFRWIKILS